MDIPGPIPDRDEAFQRPPTHPSNCVTTNEWKSNSEPPKNKLTSYDENENTGSWPYTHLPKYPRTSSKTRTPLQYHSLNSVFRYSFTTVCGSQHKGGNTTLRSRANCLRFSAETTLGNRAMSMTSDCISGPSLRTTSYKEEDITCERMRAQPDKAWQLVASMRLITPTKSGSMM